jgi:uncharacterized membrane protein
MSLLEIFLAIFSFIGITATLILACKLFYRLAVRRAKLQHQAFADAVRKNGKQG